jgi:hypothetical protein
MDVWMVVSVLGLVFELMLVFGWVWCVSMVYLFTKGLSPNWTFLSPKLNLFSTDNFLSPKKNPSLFVFLSFLWTKFSPKLLSADVMNYELWMMFKFTSIKDILAFVFDWHNRRICSNFPSKGTSLHFHISRTNDNLNQQSSVSEGLWKETVYDEHSMYAITHHLSV